MKQVIYVVDPDISLCKRIACLFASSSLTVKTFECAKTFLAQSNKIAPGCFLIINSEIPDMSTVELMQKLKQKENKISIIVMGEEDKDDISQAVKTMRAGAVDFIVKPFTDQKLKSCIEKMMPPVTLKNTEI